MPRTLFEDAYRNSTKGAGYEVQNASAGRITNCMHSVEDFVNYELEDLYKRQV